jgi:hypothetical protein
MQRVDEVDNASDVDFPGPNPPDYVLEMTSTEDDGDNGWLIHGDLPTGVQNETVCSRTYQRFGNDLPIAHDPNMRIKLQEVTVGGVTIQHEIEHGEGGNLGINYDCPDSGAVNFQLAGRTSWIRHEVCYDVGTSSVTTRQRATVIETGETEVVSCGPKSLSTPASFTLYQIGNLFLQTLGESEDIGSRYVTHAIQTRTALDTSFWPGAATELEADTDEDGLVDAEDNCTLVANPDQLDIESDGCGNVCDGDFDENGFTNATDLGTFQASYLKSEGQAGFNPEADMNADSIVNSLDLGLFKNEYLTTTGPGNPDCPY